LPEDIPDPSKLARLVIEEQRQISRHHKLLLRLVIKVHGIGTGRETQLAASVGTSN
jgi:hypothetical protein